jgi:hypothetical protein
MKVQNTIPLKMAPLVLLRNHAITSFGGSAGREEQRYKMGGALADQFSDFQTRQIRQEDSYHFRNQQEFCLSFRNALSRSAIRFRSFIF